MEKRIKNKVDLSDYSSSISPEGVGEPVEMYHPQPQVVSPCQFTLEEIEEQIRKGMKEKELGLGVSHEEFKRDFLF